MISKCTNVDVNKPTSVDLYIVQCYKIGCLFGVFLLVFHSCFFFTTSTFGVLPWILFLLSNENKVFLIDHYDIFIQ